MVVPAATLAVAARAATAALLAPPVAARRLRVRPVTAVTAPTVVLPVMAPTAAAALRLWWRAVPVLTAVMAAMAVPVVPVARPVWPEA
jgi:hypothetical protein